MDCYRRYVCCTGTTRTVEISIGTIAGAMWAVATSAWTVAASMGTHKSYAVSYNLHVNCCSLYVGHTGAMRTITASASAAHALCVLLQSL